MATLTVSDYEFHKHPTLYVQTSLSVTRANATDTNVLISGRVYFRTQHYPSNPPVYGVPPYTGANRGLSVVVSTSQATTGNIGSIYNMRDANGDYKYRDDRNYIDINTSLKFTSGDLNLYIDCKWTSSGVCDAGYTNVLIGTMNISQVPYNPYVPPVLPTYVALSTNSLKPDQSISVSWSGESPGTVGINHFQMEMSQWRGGTQIKSYVRVSGPIYYSTHGYNPCVWTTTLTSITDYDTGNPIQIRPGDTIQFHVVSYSGDGYTGWLGTVTATNTGATTGNANILVYKTGNIRYKNSSGTVIECTKGYYKDSGGTIRKLRYVKYKDSGGVTRIIDVYTTLYE